MTTATSSPATSGGPINTTQTAIVQTLDVSGTLLPLTVSHASLVPTIRSPNHVLVRVLAVALNPTDHKMTTHFPMPGATTGCDFCGTVVSQREGGGQPFALGTRVCGAVYGYNPEDPHNGAFAEYVVADARLLLRVPDSWSDLQAAALGGIGWGTVGLALWCSEALALTSRPGSPAEKQSPVLVYGAGTATGTMACQLLKLSGYAPIATASEASSALAKSYGAIRTATYTSPTCADTIKSLAAPLGPLRHALDCITDADSAAVCFGALGRTGGRYACLEAFDEAWRTRRAVRVEVVLGYEMWGNRVLLGEKETVYSRPASEEKLKVTIRWAGEMQELLDKGLIEAHPLQEVGRGWGAIIEGLHMLRNGEVRGRKLVVRIADS
ncbi:related to C.carbonum toxD protein [Cephalotrichum gorgonifer]|uniref:Related to C.carbonum toxD protein n=1 Tax=Cephalotrichum gorgonifer TaxID=2041049 RepID=A0AAE8MYS7_9PEZI|nr:related to C.carbonum toxD protein [Cephalotrichum gorgonifer]